VTVEPGSKALRMTGLVATMVGGLGALAGGGLLLVGIVTQSGDVGTEPRSLRVGGGIALGASAAVIGAGLVMSYFGTTFVEIEPGAAGSASASADPLTIRW